MRILLTNDDGIAAPGLAAMHRALKHLGEVLVVAPSSVQSAMGHAVTFHKKVTTRKQRIITARGDDIEGYAVDGRPADCVKLGVNHLLKEEGPIDLVVSGMNAGCNVGVNVNYSGTVAAAREGSIQGIPSIAVSLHIGDRTRTRWDAAAEHAMNVIEAILAGPHEPDVCINLNVPIIDDEEPKGVKTARISTAPLADLYEIDHDIAGDPGYTVHSSIAFRDKPIDTDVHALWERFITVTPMCLDATHYGHMEKWETHLGAVKRDSE